MRIAALGDSTSCGEGVGVRVPVARTWPAVLAAAVPGARLTLLARAGARVRDVRAGQLAAAVAGAPDVATVLAGLNDVARSDLDPAALADDLGAVVSGLRAAGAVVVLGRLHDPGRVLPLPAGVRAAVRGRVGAVNAAVDAAAADPGVLVLDLAAVPSVTDRRAWDVDRLHPTAALHARIAAAAGALLTAAGLPVRVPDPPPLPPTPGPARELAWAARHGLPWVAAHLTGLVAAARELGDPRVAGSARDGEAAPGGGPGVWPARVSGGSA
ncbi:GDSL-type esterase/lipase family protein [Geodermatophilus sp. FMUSA9-8]|uniref:GDSL-type esterase/lipase family protein n=1 Tax=Geodermatophilus sp. FMUSA9-8 TaxID=3120155 RepID=UPI00300B6BA5